MTTTDLLAAAYVRVSDAGQDQEGTPETQRLRIETHAAQRSEELGRTIRIVRWYQDVYTGGDSYFDPGRRDFQQLRRDIAGRAYKMVLAYKDDRIARGAEILSFCLECDHADTAVETALDGPLDAEGLLGSLTLLMRGSGSKEELRKIRARAADGWAKRARDNKRVPGCRPRYGYAWDDAAIRAKTKLVADPRTAPVIRRIFAEYAAGASLRAVAEGLNRDRIPTPTQHAGVRNAAPMWQHNAVRSLLSDGIYTGRAVTLQTRIVREKGPDGNTRKRARPVPTAEQVVLPEGTVPALIDADAHETARVRLATNRLASVRATPDPESTLLRAGFAFCGYCRNTLITENRKDGPGRRYVCSPKNSRRHGCPGYSVNAGVLDGFVWGKVSRALKDPETMVADLRRRRDTEPEDGAVFDLAVIDRELKDVDHNLAGLARDVGKLAGHEYATAALVAQMRTLDGHRGRLSASRAEAVARLAQRSDDEGSLERFAATMRAMQTDVDTLGYDGKRDAMLRLGVRAEVRREDDGPRIAVTARVDLDRFERGFFEREGNPRIERVTVESAAGERRHGGELVVRRAGSRCRSF